MRGSGPSRTHKLDYYDADGWLHRDGFFWEFDYNDLAEEDLPAMIKKVYEVSGHCKKVTVIGHSLGATILPNGLSKSEHAKHYVSQAISMAPCFAPDSLLLERLFWLLPFSTLADFFSAPSDALSSLLFGLCAKGE